MRMPKKRRVRVPEILWRLFRDRARTLANTITSFLPPSPSSPEECRCRGMRCLSCSVEPLAFLLRSDDPPAYRKLLTQCFVVVSEDALPPPRVYHRFIWSQSQIVERTIELLLSGEQKQVSSNVLCSDYEKNNHSSPILEVLSCSSWGLLLKRVGDEIMVYLLRHTSIFLPYPKKQHYQVAGPPISNLCPKSQKNSLNCDYQHPSLQHGVQRKRHKGRGLNSVVEKQNCHCTLRVDDMGCADRTHLTASIKCQEKMHRMTSLPQALYSSNVANQESNEELQQSSNHIRTKLGKRPRPFSWQRPRKHRQLSLEESLHLTFPLVDGACTDELCRESNKEPILGPNHSRLRKRTRPFKWQRGKKCRQFSFEGLKAKINFADCLLATSQNMINEKLSWPCSCCLVLLASPSILKRVEINRQRIFYNLESSASVLPEKHVLNLVKPSLSGSKYLIRDVFRLPEVNSSAQPVQYFHNCGSSISSSACLYHSLTKWLKSLIRRTQSCQYIRLLDKHCVKSHSAHEDSLPGTKSWKKSHGFDANGRTSAHGVVDPLSEFSKSCCTKNQVVSFIWAVCRSILPIELLGTPSNWRIMRRNIARFIQLRRFEKFSLELCIHGLKTSRFPFLSDKYFSSCLGSEVFKYKAGFSGEIQNELNKWKDSLHAIKHKLLERWIYWFFNFLVVPLVQAHFYVTENEHDKQEIHYYRKSFWETLTKKVTTSLQDWGYSYLDDLAVRNILKNRLFGFSKLRILPKENGVRMVANMKGSSKMPKYVSSGGVQFSNGNYAQNKKFCNGKRKSKFYAKKVKFNFFQSVNSVLHDTHAILKGIMLNEREILGSSVFDYNDVYKKLCPFLIGLKKGLRTMPGLFIVISDVSKAFDSVDQDKLLWIMKDVLRENEYFLKQYCQSVCTKKSLWFRKCFKLYDDSIYYGYARLIPSVPYHSRHSIWVNQGGGKQVKKKVVLSIIKEHVKHNILQFDANFFLQGVGIPQGGILSSLLCSLYYGHLERTMIFPFLDKTCESACCNEDHTLEVSMKTEISRPPCYILLRFIDDILFISTSRRQADSFYSRLRRGFRNYNCYMNEKKFGVNFDVSQVSRIKSSRMYMREDGASFLRWSGLLINCFTLEIQADYTKYLKSHLRATLTVSWHGNRGLNLKEKLCSFLRPKFHPIFFDSNINSAAVVRLNVYQLFLLAAMKFHCYCCHVSYIYKLHKGYCLSSIERSLRYMHILLKRRMRSLSPGSDFRPFLKLEKEEVEWLGLHAYVQVLKRKQSRYKELLALLNSKLLAHRMSRSLSSELEYATNATNSSLLWKIKY